MNAREEGLPQVQLKLGAGGTLSPHIDGQPEHRFSLGSQDLIRFAAYAASNGWPAVSFELGDPALDPIPQEQQDLISSEMLRILGTFGEAELHAAMQDEFDDFYVLAVNTADDQTGHRVKLMRRGVLATSVPAAQALISAAWRHLRLP
ncbi:hypothetical protein [Arthrobacter sp. IK3]|uniref:hypothetical protein n=1 Tax=Arthrobacter sp. IK3 TaxID=3448169 RepID=UPI003EDF30DE